ncbi:hypothetical protein [Porphyromonas uenonis]|uniref:hypothetical protein n=1 Tax=Porphyromonas uenonis TaxID=281920 RepID=UPI0026732F70|nr:hypothetical protein [Porphyromonas uenonis]
MSKVTAIVGFDEDGLRATRHALTGTDAQIVRPYKGLLVSCVRTYGYSSRFDTTDAQIVRPYAGLHVSNL